MIRSRNEIWSLHRRVPVKYKDIESRKLIWMSLWTKDKQEATEKAEAVWEALIGAWNAKLSGDEEKSAALFRKAEILAYKSEMKA